jgi:hypothetical protein
VEPRPPASGYDDLVRTFREWELATPPVPAELRPRLRRPDDLPLWTTRDIDPMEMYFLRTYPGEVFQGPVDDYLAVSHAGHGINSYGLNVHLVLGPLAVFAQDGFGGVYMDAARCREEIAATMEGLGRLLDRLPTPREGVPGIDRSRIVLLWSGFRGNCECTVVGRVAADGEPVPWEHRGPFSGMGWRPRGRPDGRPVDWTEYGSKAELFEAVGEVLAEL